MTTGTLVLAVGLGTVVFTAGLGHAATDPASVCKEAKARTAGTKASALLAAFANNIKAFNPVRLAADISKAQSKMTAGFNNAESAGGCGTAGDVGAIEAKVDAFVASAIEGGVCTDQSACCSGNLGLLSFETGLASGNCGVLRNFRCSNDANKACAVDADCGALNTCNEVIGGGLPLYLKCGSLYIGGGGLNSVPLPILVPDMGKLYTSVTSCNPATGVMISGPTASGDGGGIVTGRTCTTGRECSGNNDHCVLDSDCPSTQTCDTQCLFGSPLPLPNTTTPPLSICSVSDVAQDASGTAQCDGGDMEVSLPLRFNLFLTGDLFSMSTPPNIPGVQPCPLCDTFCVGGANNEFPCDVNSDCNAGVCETSTRCLGGPNDGEPCTPATSDSGTLGDAHNTYPTSHDCPPEPSVSITDNIGGIPMSFALTSGTVVRNAQDLNPLVGGSRVFAGFCRDGFGAGTGCFEGDTYGACPSAIPEADGNAVPCDSDADCADADEYESCAQRNSGAFGRAGTTQITLFGASDGQCLGDGATHAATLVSVFDIPPTFEFFLLDPGFDLPGPGAVMLQGAAQLPQ